MRSVEDRVRVMTKGQVNNSTPEIIVVPPAELELIAGQTHRLSGVLAEIHGRSLHGPQLKSALPLSAAWRHAYWATQCGLQLLVELDMNPGTATKSPAPINRCFDPIKSSANKSSTLCDLKLADQVLRVTPNAIRSSSQQLLPMVTWEITLISHHPKVGTAVHFPQSMHIILSAFRLPSLSFTRFKAEK